MSSLFMTALLWECVIASVYWTLLYPDDKARLTTPASKWWNFCEHLIPICVLTIDWFLNRVYFEINQIWPNMLVFMLYGLVNIGVSKGRGYPVYAEISWDSVGAWFLGAAMVPLAAVFYVALYYLTRLKFRLMKMHDAIEYTSVVSVEGSESDV